MDLARPARCASVAKIVVSAGFLVAFSTVAREYPMLYAGFIFLPSAALTVVRHVRVLTLSPLIRVSDIGLRVKVWDTRFLVPWVFEQERTIAWADFTGATVHTMSVNGFDTSSLVIAYKGGSIEIEPGVFAESASELQHRILDRYARGKQGPEVAPLAKADPVFRQPPAIPSQPIALATGISGDDTFDKAAVRAGQLAVRFKTPLVIQNGYTRQPAAIAAGVGVLIIAVGVLIAPEVWFLWTGPAVIAFIFAAGMLGRYAMEDKVRRIELRSDGFGYGPSDRELVIVPWGMVTYAMLSTTNGAPTNVRVAFSNGGEVVLHGNYDRPLPEIRALIDPKL